MGEVAKQTFKQVSETMFPGISESYKNQNMYRKSSVGSYLGISKKSPAIKLGNEIVSDLPLQMALFFNVCYFPAWLIISIVITSDLITSILMTLIFMTSIFMKLILIKLIFIKLICMKLFQI